MDKLFFRNFLIFAVVLLAVVAGFSYVLVSGEEDLQQTDDLVLRTHNVIIEAEQLTTYIESILAAQRAYIITGDPTFAERYEEKKAQVSENLASLTEMTSDNHSQQSRLSEIRTFITELTTKLEERVTEHDAVAKDPIALGDVEIIDGLRNNIVRLNNAVLKEEYDLLNQRVIAVEQKKKFYLVSLVSGMLAGAIILILFNGILLYAQRKKSRAEASLKDSQDRFALAIEGSRDGIFDWDVSSGQIFYSGRFFGMLGYDRGPFMGTPEDFKEVLHPEEAEHVWQNLERYVNNELSEYHQEFRMKHKTGRWVWVQSTGKALYDAKGNVYRVVGANNDISHIKMNEERLRSEKKQAEESNRAKSEFLAHMSHEIRTPLTAINGIAEILEKNHANLNDKQKQLVKTLNTSTSSLKDLINDILDFSKIEEGEIELNEQSFDLDVMFEEVVSMMALRSSEKGISFVLDYEEVKGAEFYGDKIRLRQIVVNLIGNAIKFTEEGGVTVKTGFEDREDGEWIRIDVSDTGIGIAAENFDLVFERFKQADSSVSRKYGGTGLGLPISRNLARLMGGDIILSSAPGSGSTFTVLLPLKISREKATVKTQIADTKITDKIRSAIQGKTKLLLVEDYEGNIVVISYILDDIGLNYDIANTGAEAVELWKNNHYDVVLMDVQMPEMDGFAATKAIREMEEGKKLSRTPIIGMTAHALVGDKDKCIEAGMDSYLPKPIVEDDLKREILSYLDTARKTG